MKYRAVTTIAAIATMPAGFVFMSWGPLMLRFYGVPELPLAAGPNIPFWCTLSFVRLFGAILFGLGLVTWFARNLVEPVQQRAAALGHFFACLAACTIALTQQIAIWETTAGWITVAAFFLLAVAFGYLGYVELGEAVRRRPPMSGTDIEDLRDRWKQQISAAAAQQERNRLARDLHDSIKQQIFSVSVSAAAAQARWESDPAGARSALDDVRSNAREAMVEMEAMLQQLHPSPLETVGLIEALRKQCEALQYRTSAQVTAEFFDLPENERLPLGTQEAIFRIAREALANVARHARARSVQVKLHASEDNRSMWLKIEDDGQGFDPAAASQGMGVANMRARVREIDGQMDLQSAPGAGTRLAVRIPLQASVEQEAQRRFQLGILNASAVVLILMVFLPASWGKDKVLFLVAIPLALPFLLLAISRFHQVHLLLHQPGTQKLSWARVFADAFRN